MVEFPFPMTQFQARRGGLKNISMNECNDPKHQAEKMFPKVTGGSLVLGFLYLKEKVKH